MSAWTGRTFVWCLVVVGAVAICAACSADKVLEKQKAAERANQQGTGGGDEPDTSPWDTGGTGGDEPDSFPTDGPETATDDSDFGGTVDDDSVSGEETASSAGSGDDCASAMLLSLDDTATGDLSASSASGSCSAEGDDQFWAVQVLETGDYKITVSPEAPDLDVDFFVHADSCESCSASVTDGAEGQPDSTTYAASAPSSLYIQVYRANSGSGTYTITVTGP